MQTTPDERLVLGVLALLIAAGTVVRFTGPAPASPEWRGDAAVADSGTARLGQRVDAEVQRARRRAVPLAEGERIDPNSADVDELQRLPRVGPVLAARIVAHREEHGPFRTLADLDAVSGIGPALLAGVTPHVALPPAPPAAAVSSARTSPAAPTSRPSPRETAAPSPSALLDLNRATAEELQRLPGIGPALAERIIEWRRAHGPFRTVQGLQKVPGIGARTLERLAPLVRAG
ncbi:MAG: ComEA family DNA-binding protein [Longimicrobiaceae bacterium]